MPTLKVTLDQTTTPWTVVVDPDPIDIPRNANPQSIHWHLVGNAYGGKFKSLGGAPPPFAWSGAEQPLPGIFEDPTLSPKKKALTIKDKHTGPGSSSGKKGWSYALSIVVDGATYQTAGSASIQGKDPVIKNN